MPTANPNQTTASQAMSASGVAILDAGGQYVDLVKKAVERLGVPAEVVALSTPIQDIENKYRAIIISGSPASSHAEAAPQPDPDIWKTDMPLLGICYGMQSMVVSQGGLVEKNAIREDGRITTEVKVDHPLFASVKKEFSALFTHGDFVKKLPEGYVTIGSHKMSDGNTAYSAIASGNKLGVQFHPEVFDDTPQGYQVFKNFLAIAGIKADKSFRSKRLKQIIKAKQAEIKSSVNGRPVVAFVSGGVDSSVAIKLASEVIPEDKLHAYFIDHGFIRDEDEQVIETLLAAGIKVNRVNAVEEFEEATIEIDGKKIGPLVNTADPEHKRKIIGRAFIDFQNEIIKDLKLSEALLLQGTNAADRIESGHSKGDSHTMTIKTHHNQVKEVQDLKEQGLLLEPLDDLFKDEIRELGRQLGLPDELVDRQPFPGPGLAIRIIATAETKADLEPEPVQSEVDEFMDTYYGPMSIITSVLPISSVGVGGDERSHLSVIALFGKKLDSFTLRKLGTELPANFRSSINRVIYSLGHETVIKVSQNATLLTSDVRSQLRLADRIVFEEMREYGLLNQITQFPVVLIPISINNKGKRSIVLRPVLTSTFMTVQAMLPDEIISSDFFNRVRERILNEDPNISEVFLDLTNKPPATTEWE